MPLPSLAGALTAPIEIKNENTSGTVSVTIPADTEFLVVLAGGWAPTYEFVTMTLDGVAIAKTVSQISPDNQNGWIHTLANPATGTVDFSWSITDIQEGIVYYLAPLKNVANTNPITGFAFSAGSVNPVTPSFNSTDNDLVLAVCTSFGAAIDIGVAGQTEIADSGVFNQDVVAVGQKSGVSGTTTMQAATADGFAVIGAISILGTVGGGGGGPALPIFVEHYKKQGGM